MELENDSWESIWIVRSDDECGMRGFENDLVKGDL